MEKRRKRMRRNNFPYRSLSNRGPSFKRNQKGVEDIVSPASFTKRIRRRRRSGW